MCERAQESPAVCDKPSGGKMDWLSCNKCYRILKAATIPFLMTQCGHVYCSPCIKRMGKSCHQCGSDELKFMPLKYPPELVASFNYFSPLDDIIDLCSKAANFQVDQMIIAARGGQETAKKGMACDVGYANTMKETQALQMECEKVQKDRDKLCAHKSRLASEARASTTEEPMEIQDHCDSQRVRHPQFSASQRRPEQSQRRPGLGDQRSADSSEQYREPPPESRSSNDAMMHTPAYPYNPRHAFSRTKCSSGASDSGCSTLAHSSGERVGGFLVPSIQRVPKSAATAKRKTPTGVRLSAPMSPNEL